MCVELDPYPYNNGMWAGFSCALHAAKCMEVLIVQIVIRNDGTAGKDRLLGDKDGHRLRPSFVRGLARSPYRCITRNASSVTPTANRGAALASSTLRACPSISTQVSSGSADRNRWMNTALAYVLRGKRGAYENPDWLA